MEGTDIDDWAIYIQVTINHKAPHQKVWLVERHHASIRNALQRCDAQAINESFCVSFQIVLG